MRLYLEILEILSEEEELTRQQQMLRIEVKSKEHAMEVLKVVEPLFRGLKCEKRLHYCYHDEGKPCEIKPIE